MTASEIDLSKFSSAHFDRGASSLKEALWIIVRALFFLPSWPWPSSVRIFLLRLFGADIGRGVVVRSRVNVWFPWRLVVGDHVWIGEEVFILNLAPVTVESHVCISQRAFLCTGSHDHRVSNFPLIVKPIVIHTGSWVAAQTFIGPGVSIGPNSVVGACGVAMEDVPEYVIVRGNPAVVVKGRMANS